MKAPVIEKVLSASDLEGVCPPRYVGERWLGDRAESEAMVYGRQVHAIAEQVNLMRKDGKDPSVDEIRRLVAESPIPLGDKVRAEMSVEWWAARTYGTRPIDVERVMHVTVGEYKVQVKPDCVRIDETNGRLHVDDYKTGWVPDEEVAERDARFVLYAVACAHIYGAKELWLTIWNLGEQYAVTLKFTADKLNRVLPYVEGALRNTATLMEKIEVARKHGGRRSLSQLVSRLIPKLNGYCPSCDRHAVCPLYRRLMLEGVFPEGTNELERLEYARIAKRIVTAAEADLSKHVQARVEAFGKQVRVERKDGKPEVQTVLEEGAWEAVVKTQHTAEKEVDQSALWRDLLAHGVREEKPTGVMRSLKLKDGMVVNLWLTKTQDEEVGKQAKREGQRRRVMIRSSEAGTAGTGRFSGSGSSKPSSHGGTSKPAKSPRASRGRSAVRGAGRSGTGSRSTAGGGS
jgi:hypothetical protein